MQRVDDTYLAKLRFDAAGVKHFDPALDLDGAVNVHKTGHALSAIVLTSLKLAAGAQMPAIPDFKYIANDEFDDITDFTISGYPDLTLAAGAVRKEVPTKNKMYSASGRCESREGKVVACKLLASKG